jgi:hypothetical protein
MSTRKRLDSSERPSDIVFVHDRTPRADGVGYLWHVRALVGGKEVDTCLKELTARRVIGAQLKAGRDPPEYTVSETGPAMKYGKNGAPFRLVWFKGFARASHIPVSAIRTYTE